MKCIILLAVFYFANAAHAQSAQEYFKELNDAGALNRYSDKYVCFRDDNVPLFVVIARGSTIIEHMRHAGITPPKEILSANDDILLQSYFKGVANPGGDIYEHVPKSESDYAIEFTKPLHGRIVYSFNWTLSVLPI
jgi:hypothetical protein